MINNIESIADIIIPLLIFSSVFLAVILIPIGILFYLLAYIKRDALSCKTWKKFGFWSILTPFLIVLFAIVLWGLVRVLIIFQRRQLFKIKLYGKNKKRPIVVFYFISKCLFFFKHLVQTLMREPSVRRAHCRFGYLRLLPVGLNWVARTRLEYPPPTCVPLLQIGHCFAIIGFY